MIIMTTNEFLKVSAMKPYRIYSTGIIRNAAKCTDGFSVSIQANAGAYCTPRDAFAMEYKTVELGYPSSTDSLIMDYAEDSECPTGTVYGYVPVDVVDKLIKKHGGIIVDIDESIEDLVKMKGYI